MNAGSLYAPRDQPEKRKREREREKMIDTRRPSHFSKQGPLFLFSKGSFILYLYIEGNERCKVIQSQPKHYICFVFIEIRIFFCIPFPKTMLCTLSSGLGGLWTFYDPLLIKAAQPENLFSLEMFFLYISNLCQPQKVLNRVTFLTEQRCSELQERTN